MPIIKLDSDNDISGVRINERQIAPLDIPADLIEPCYRALMRMYEIPYDPKLIITLKLKAGDGLLFNNQRILHGRTEFDAEEPARSVLTSSVDLDDFHSTMRILHRMLDAEDYPKSKFSIGNFLIEFSRASLNDDEILCDAKIRRIK